MKIPTFLKKQKSLIIAILCAVTLALFPTHPAKAVFGIDYITTTAISTVFGWFLTFIFSAVGKLIALLATGLYQVINMRIYPDGGTAVISESWKIMRDFANMFFIVALIVMAFATIFDVLPGAAKYNARALFGRFILTALLINFSLVIGVMVINGTQVLSNTFLTSIGDMSSRLGQGLINNLPIKPDQISANTVANTLDGSVFGSIITLLFSVVLLFTFMFSLLTAFIFALIRIPIIWALLVVSPIAWIMNIFPAGEGMFKKWWSMFIGWNMFLPIFLFFLYFGLYFLQNQGDVISKIATQTANQPLGGTSFTFQILFFYVLAGIFLIGGTIVAMKASMFSGTGVVSVAGFARKAVANRLGMYVPGKGYVSLGAAGQAAQEKWKEIQSKPPIGLDTARGLMRVQGGEFKQQKEFVSKMEQEITKIKDQETAGKVVINDNFRDAALRENRNTARGAAMRAVLYERGMIDPAEFDKDMAEWTQKNPFLAQKMNELAKKGKYKKIPGKQLNDMYTAQAGGAYAKYRTAGATATRKDWFSFAAENDDNLKTMDSNHVAAGIGLFGGKDSNDGKEKLKAIAKKRPDIVAEYKLKEDGITLTPAQLSRYIFKEIKNKSPKELSEMLEPTWQNISFQDALRKKANLLQRIQRPVPPSPAIPAGAPGGPKRATKGKPGGGDQFRESLKKATQSNPSKLRVARTI